MVSKAWYISLLKQKDQSAHVICISADTFNWIEKYFWYWPCMLIICPSFKAAPLALQSLSTMRSAFSSVRKGFSPIKLGLLSSVQQNSLINTINEKVKLKSLLFWNWISFNKPLISTSHESNFSIIHHGSRATNEISINEKEFSNW